MALFKKIGTVFFILVVGILIGWTGKCYIDSRQVIKFNYQELIDRERDKRATYYTEYIRGYEQAYRAGRQIRIIIGDSKQKLRELQKLTLQNRRLLEQLD